MTKKEEKKYFIMAILINVGIFGCVALCITGAITNILWLVYTAFAFLGVIGIFCPVLTAVIKFKSASDDDKRIAKKQLDDAKKTLLNMDKKELTTFICVTTVIVLLFILIIVFGTLSNFNSKFLVPMFICIGLFVFGGLGVGLITIHSQKSKEKKILKDPSSETLKTTVISRELFSSVNGKEKFRYEFLISGKKHYGVSSRKLEQGDEVVVAINKKFAKHCAIL